MSLPAVRAEADGLSLTEFLRVMLKVLPSEDDSREGQLSLVESLVEMFKSVDVNGDRSMEWAEFSSFIAEMGLTATLPSSAAPVRVSYREREGFIDMTNQRALDKVEVVEWPPVAPPASEAVKMALSGGRAPKPQRPIEFWTLESESATVRVWEAGKRPTLQDPSGGTAPPGGDKHSEQTKADVAVILGIDPSKEPKMTKQQKLDAEMINPRTAKQAAALRGATSLAPMRLKYEINITASASTPAGGGSASRAGHTKQLAAGRSAATGRAASRRGWAAGVGEDDDGEDGGKAGGAAGASDSKSRREKHAGKVDKIPEPSIQAWQFMWDQKLLAIAQSDCRISVWNLPSGGPPGPLPGLRPGAPIDSGERVGGSGIGGAGGAGGGDSGARSGRKPRRLPQGGFSQFDSIITRGPPSALAYCRQLLYATDTIGKGSIVAYHIPSMQLVHRWQPHGDRIPCILALTPRALGFSRATGSSSSTAGPGARLPGGSPRSTITVSSARSRGVAGAPVETAAAGSGGLLVTASLDGTVRCMHLAAPLETVVGEFNRRKRAERALGRAADGDHKTGSADDSAADAAGSDDDEAPLAAAAAGASPGGSSSNLASLLAKRKRIEVGETSADGKPQYPMVPEVSGGSETVHKLSPHPRGARHLCFLAAEGLLVTAGFDQDAMAFELPAGRLKLTLKGHRHPIVQAREVWQGHNGIGLGGAGLQAIPRPKPPSMRRSAADVVDGGAEAGGNASGELVHSRCLTLDQSSCFRLWDMRPNPTGLAACLLQFDTGSAMPGSFTSYRSHCFGVTRWSGDLVVGGTKLHHLVPLAHANEISSPAIVVYNPLSHCFYVMGGARATSAGSVRVYDAKRGVLSRTFPDMSPAPVTVASLDDRQRKLIVGTQGGDVTVHNAASGGLMKSLDKAHPTGSEITAMEYVVGTKLLLTASWDRTVRLFDEDPPHACVGVRSVARAHDADITAASASNNLVLMASADALSFVKVWDMETLKLDGACIGHGGGIQCVQFVEPYPLLLVADKEGRVVMWGMRGTSKGALYQPVVLLQNHSRKQEEATNLQLDPGHEHVTDDKDQESAAAAGSAAGSDEVDAGGMRDGAAPGRGGTASALGEQEPRKAVPVTSMVQTFWPFDIDPSSKHGSAYLPGDTSGDIAAVRQGLGLPPLGAGEGVEAQASAEMHSPAAFHKEARTGRAVPAKGHGGARRALVLGDENGWITVVDLTAMIQRTRVQAFVRGAGDGQDGRPSSTASKHGVELAMARRMSADITAAGARLRTAPQARTAGTAAAARRLSVSMPGASLPMATVDGSTAAAAEVIGTREE
jgi:WD40 repeat protein